jgi:hypothetical protein
MRTEKPDIFPSSVIRFFCKPLYACIFLAVLASSCAPVNRFTRLKRTPREYSLNYCYSDTKARKSPFNRESWIVFSDREDNDTYRNAGGKVKMKKMSFMEAFFVVGEKGDYLRLIKYDPEIVEDNPYARIIKDRKKALYYGWAHRSHLLLTKQSSLDIATGFKNKAAVIVSDTLAVVEPRPYFEADSVLAYRDENLTVRHSRIPAHELLYILKASADDKKVLVSRKTTLNPTEAPSETLGWISTSVIREIGQRLFVDIESVRGDSLSGNPVFPNKKRTDTVEISAEASMQINLYGKIHPAFRYSPVRSYAMDSGRICFTTALPAPVIDRRFNYVLNLNGNKIMFEDLLRLEKDLKKLNLIFVFEGRERVYRDYVQIMTVVQNLQPMFEREDDPYQYGFGAVIACQDTLKSRSPILKTCELTDSYSGVMDFLMAETDSIARYSPVATGRSWTGLRKAVDMIEARRDETNILVVIGESGYGEKADSILVRRIAEANGRILGYQVYSETLSNADNNFVLQIENMIDGYTQHDAVLRRERLVYTGQYRPDVRYRESGRNVYALDYPQRSMTQGAILFPGKTEAMQPDILVQSIDTLLAEVRHDNDTVITCLYRAFAEFGSRRNLYDPLWMDYYGRDSLWQPDQELPRRMARNLPAWFMPSDVISVSGTDKNLDYRLLLSENELEEITGFLEEITKYEPDYRYRETGKRKRAQKPCNCPDDDLPTEETRGERMYDGDGNPLYLNTRSIRRHVYRTLVTRLKASYRLIRTKPCRLKYYSLAKAELEIVGNPTKGEPVNAYQIRDLKSRSRMKDYELDALLLYYRDKKDALEGYLHAGDKSAFISNGETFYWISRELLP